MLTSVVTWEMGSITIMRYYYTSTRMAKMKQQQQQQQQQPHTKYGNGSGANWF